MRSMCHVYQSLLIHRDVLFLLDAHVRSDFLSDNAWMATVWRLVLHLAAAMDDVSYVSLESFSSKTLLVINASLEFAGPCPLLVVLGIELLWCGASCQRTRATRPNSTQACLDSMLSPSELDPALKTANWSDWISLQIILCLTQLRKLPAKSVLNLTGSRLRHVVDNILFYNWIQFDMHLNLVFVCRHNPLH